MRPITAVAAGLLALTATAAAAQDKSVQSLLNDGYTIAGVVPSTAGPGIFLQKGTALFVCFVSEKPDSATVKTQYYKPVN